MKFLVGSLVFLGVVVVILFGGMATTSTVLIMLSCFMGSVIAWPMVIVAVYRLLSGAAGGRLMWVASEGKTAAPAKARAPRSVMGDL